MLALGVVGLATYLHARNTEAAIESIAVLPFDNQSNNPDAEYMSDGITETIINSLTRLPNLKVIPRSVAFRYKGKPLDPQKIGDELRVNAVLTGRIVQRGDNVTVSVELDDVRYGKELWGEQYNRRLADLLAVQSDIASEISQRVRWRPTSEQRQKLAKGPTENPEAYQLYLKGRFFTFKQTKEGLEKGLDYFNQAIAIDPNYALAYTGVGFYYNAMSGSDMSSNEAMPKAREAARKALALDETVSDAHLLLGSVAIQYDWDWATAEQEFKRAIELNPNDPRPHEWYAGALSINIARAEQTIAEAEKAQWLDPVSAETNWFLGVYFYNVHRYDEAIDQLRKTVELDPNYWPSHEYLGLAYAQKGNLPEAIKELQRAHEIERNFPEPTRYLGAVYALAGKQSEALKIIEQLKAQSSHSYVDPYNIAAVYAGLGDKDRAMEWLNRAYAERSNYLPGLKVDPFMDLLRSDPRFDELVKRVGIP
jgi:TolB-like protein/Flp pilus assembly protein TadD